MNDVCSFVVPDANNGKFWEIVYFRNDVQSTVISQQLSVISYQLSVSSYQGGVMLNEVKHDNLPDNC